MFFPSAFPELSLYKMENMGRTLGAATTKWKTWVEPCVDPLQNHKHRSKTRKGLYKIQNWSLLGWALTGLEPVFWIAWHSLATTRFQTAGRRLAPTSTWFPKAATTKWKAWAKGKWAPLQNPKLGFVWGLRAPPFLSHVLDFVEGTTTAEPMFVIL